MSSSFSIDVSHFSSFSDAALHDEVRSHTGCDEEAASILRSIERLGADPSIWRYEMTPMQQRRYAHPTKVSWSVRAVRP